MENGRHRVVKHFRFTETEAAKLRKLAKEFNMTESEYIRLLLINEVNHVGNNINQIARKNNAGFYSRNDMESLRAYMRKLIMSTREVEKCIGSYEGS